MENTRMNYDLNQLKIALLDPETEIVSSTKTVGSKPQQIKILQNDDAKKASDDEKENIDINQQFQKNIVILTVQKDMLSRNLAILFENAKTLTEHDITPFDLIDEPFRYGWEIALVIDEKESDLNSPKKKVAITNCSFVPEQWVDNLFTNHMINLTMEEIIWLQTETNFKNFNLFISSSQLNCSNNIQFKWYIAHKQKAPNVFGYITEYDFPEDTITKLGIAAWTNQYNVWGSTKVKATTTYVPVILKNNFNESIKCRKIIASLANYIYTYMKFVWSDADDGFVIKLSDIAPLKNMIDPIFKQSEPLYNLNIPTEEFLGDILRNLGLLNKKSIFYFEPREIEAIIEKEVQTRIEIFSDFAYNTDIDMSIKDESLYILNRNYQKFTYKDYLDETYISGTNTFHIVPNEKAPLKTEVLHDSLIGTHPKSKKDTDIIVHTPEKSLDQSLSNLFQPERTFDFNQKYYLGKSSLFTLSFDSTCFEYYEFNFNKEK